MFIQLHLPSSSQQRHLSSCVDARLVQHIVPSPPDSGVWVTVETPMLRFLWSGSSGHMGEQGYVSIVVFERDPSVLFSRSGAGSVMSRRVVVA
jgi:hypothetical protein